MAQNTISHARMRTLTFTALFVALEFILNFTPIGMISFGVIAITFMQVPVILAVLAEGVYAGGIVALTFGGISLYRALSAPGLFDQLFVNPLISILPRLLIVPATYFAFRGAQYVYAKYRARKGLAAKPNSRLPYGIAAGVGSAANTVFTVGAISIAVLANPASIGITADAVGAYLATLYAAIAVNSVLECFACVLVTVAVALAFRNLRRKA